MKSYAEFEIPEYWVVDPLNALLEQYILIEQQYKLVEVYIGDQSVQSDKLSCISFTINELLSEAADLPNE